MLLSARRLPMRSVSRAISRARRTMSHSHDAVDTLMECQRCSWTKTLTAADVDRELDTFERYIARARKGAA